MSELQYYAEGPFSLAVNGESGYQSVDLITGSDGAYEVLSLSRNEAGNIYTICASGHYYDPTFGGTYDSFVQMDVSFVFDSKKFGAAIISDAVPGVSGDTGKKLAQDGNVVFDIDLPITIVGGVIANGGVYDDFTELDLDTIGNSINVEYEAVVDSQKSSTPDPVPDYTEPGGVEQLFDFGRYIAAADAMDTLENPTHFTSLDNFLTEVYAERQFRGIVVVDVDPAEFVKMVDGAPEITGGQIKLESPKLKPGTGTPKDHVYYSVPDIDVEGTLLFNYTTNIVVDGVDYGATPPLFKIFIESGLMVNAPAPAAVTQYEADYASYDSAVQAWIAAGGEGDPPAVPDFPDSAYPAFGSEDYTGINPWDVNIEPAYPNFEVDDDFPAIMYNTGIVDIHGNTYISGVIYTPSFVEIEQKQAGNMQFIEGTIIAGGGIFLESKNGPIIIRYNEEALDRLATRGLALKAPLVSAWSQPPACGEGTP